MRAAIYGRVSSERQEKEHTIGSQLEALRAYAATNGMDIVEEFTDEGYSGARLDRPALDRMRDLAERHGFEVLLTYCTDRLARKFVLQALIMDELIQAWQALPRALRRNSFSGRAVRVRENSPP